MGRIFLSYAREDRDCAERLASVLQENGHEVWWDRHLDGGEEFSAEIEAALAQSEVVLVAWSKHSVKSRWVRDEAAVGGDTGRLLPLSIDGSLAPMGFRQFHTIDLTGWKGGKRDARSTALLHSIERRLSGKLTGQEIHAPALARRLSSFVTAKRMWVLVAVVASLVAAAVGYFEFGGGNRAASHPSLTVALVRFTTSSSDRGLRDVAAQITDSLSHTLQQSGISVRMLDAPPKDIRGSADFVLSGEVSRNGDKLLATVRMDQVEHGVTVFTRQFEGSGPTVGDLPERIGAQIAGSIAWAAPLMELEMGHPSDPSVTADLMRQLDFLGDPLQGYQASQQAVAKDPDSAFAHVALAFNTAFTLAQLPLGERAQAVNAGRSAAARALKLAPEFGDAHSVICFLRSETLIGDCEERLRTARQIDPDTPFADAFLSSLLRRVGRFGESRPLAQLSYARDPYVPTKIGWMLRSLEFSGEHEAAETLYRQGLRWWPEFSNNYFENRSLALLERGDWQSIVDLEQKTALGQRPSDYRDSAALRAAVESRSVAAVNAECSRKDEYWLNLRCLVAYISVGDLDRAFTLADKLYPNRVGRTSAETERIWLEVPDPPAPVELITSPSTAGMRRDSRYLALAERTGLLSYWRNGPLPDFCGNQPEPMCAQLRKKR